MAGIQEIIDADNFFFFTVIILKHNLICVAD